MEEDVKRMMLASPTAFTILCHIITLPTAPTSAEMRTVQDLNMQISVAKMRLLTSILPGTSTISSNGPTCTIKQCSMGSLLLKPRCGTQALHSST